MKSAEALSAADISEAQNEHYNLDDKLRRTLGQLTLAQKRDIVDKVMQMTEKLQANDNQSGS